MSSSRKRRYRKKTGILGQSLEEYPYVEIGDEEVEDKGKGITRKIGEKWTPRKVWDLGIVTLEVTSECRGFDI